MDVYLRSKFEVCSIILASFRQGVILTSPTSKRTPKKPTQIKVNVTYLDVLQTEAAVQRSSVKKVFLNISQMVPASVQREPELIM